MEQIGLFDAKTRLSEICDTVARSGQPVPVTRRGKPLVRIEPVRIDASTISERRAAYITQYGAQEQADEVDFEAPPRSQTTVDFRLEE